MGHSVTNNIPHIHASSVSGFIPASTSLFLFPFTFHIMDFVSSQNVSFTTPKSCYGQAFTKFTVLLLLPRSFAPTYKKQKQKTCHMLPSLFKQMTNTARVISLFWILAGTGFFFFVVTWTWTETESSNMNILSL